MNSQKILQPSLPMEKLEVELLLLLSSQAESPTAAVQSATPTTNLYINRVIIGYPFNCIAIQMKQYCTII
jgi:hypothetical protein